MAIVDTKPADGKKDQKTIKDLKSSETILLVEDNEQVRRLAYTILIRQGYKVIWANNSDEAKKTLELCSGPVHLLLTDVVMPGGINGRELYEKIVQQHPRLKVLYMSGYTDNIIVHRGVLEKGVHFIQKPFSNQTLSIKVRKVLDEAN